MNEEQIIEIASYSNAVGTIIAAIGEVRSLMGIDGQNVLLSIIGDALQALSGFLGGIITSDEELCFAGNWITGVGAGAASAASYLAMLDQLTEEEALRLNILGDTLQATGDTMCTITSWEAGDERITFGNAAQALGAKLRGIGGTLILKGDERTGQRLSTLGAILQAIGANSNAFYELSDLSTERARTSIYS
ncbi:DUF6944 family repetitive protein [Amphibacillus sediminis]|uniref:DUF6944 family repetitive protein n=1 Tax=Amphibacillus sediminis TaxID=360185 RepID=UPI00082AE110|nr:hypothetical protein [Amphibacillus sediminis]